MSSPEQRPPGADDPDLSVLYVGRDTDFADLVGTALEREFDHLDVRTETSLIDGISAVETDDFDCVVCEYHLRDGDGLELLTAVRSQSSSLPFVLYIANGDESVASRAISMGVTDYVRRDTGSEDFHLLANRIRNAVHQHHVHSQLHESDSVIANVYQRISDGFYAIDNDWQIVYWNEQMEARTNIPAEEVRGRDLRELFPKARGSALHHALERAMETRDPQTVETFLDAVGYRIEARIYPDEDGLSVFSRRVTAPFDHERELERYESIVETMDDAAFVLDGDGDVVFVNSRVEEVTGTDRESFVGSDFSDLVEDGIIPDGASDELRATVGDLLSGDERKCRVRLPVTDYTGAKRIFDLSLTRIGTDTTTGVVGIARDVTGHGRLIPEHESVFSRMTDAFFAVDNNWHLTYFNDRAEDLLNRTREVDIGDHLWDLFPELVGTEIHEQYLKAMDSGEPKTIEFEGALSDSWYEARLYPSETGLSVYFRDTTERRETVGELRARHKHLQTLVRNLPVAMAVVDTDGTVLLSEGKALETLSMRVGNVVGESFFDLYADVPDAIEGMRRGLEGEAVNFTVEVEGRTFEAWVEPILDDDTVEEVVSVAIDVTDRIRLEDALRDLQSVARELLTVETRDDVASVAVDAVRDVVGWPLAAVWYYDDESESLVPAAESDAARTVVGDAPIFTPDTGLVWEAYESGELHVYDSLKSEAEVFNPDTPFESEIHVPLGEYGVLIAGSTDPQPFTDTDTDLLRILSATVSSAIERAEREQKLRDRESELAAANERLDEFVSVVAHDLRNPLSVAKGYLEIALDTQDPEHFEKIDTALDRMNVLVDDLLTLARHGSPVVERENVDLQSTVSHAWSFVETGGAMLQTHELGSVLGDGSRLLQLFENLFRNSVEHGGSDVEVSVGQLGDGSGFYVEDDGVGIPEARRPQVFEHGYTTSTSGTGFGLAIVRDIVDAHGWSVQLTESERGGARFEFSGVEWASAPHEQEVQND
ncbi:PAS domain-containing protein [Haloferax sp. S1W]|uniref:hybrid sensor histidine kinase/response regulator n=1 Tax=Haloferax sp. S1W TaxID=3377110 RepID=UPI0037C5A010